jgi:2'-5' RNA ligase
MRTAVRGDGGLVILVPGEARTAVCKWQQRYPGVRSALSAPHITLAGSPFIREDEWPALRPALVECLNAFQPFEVTLKEVCVFADAPFVLWLKPEDGGAITALRYALIDQFPGRIAPPRDEHVPHVTVSVFDSLEALSVAQDAFSSEWKPTRFRVCELAYDVLDGNGTWQNCARLPLNGASVGGCSLHVDLRPKVQVV